MLFFFSQLFYIELTLTYIGEDAFNDCKKFTNIVLPANLTYIGCCAFNNIQFDNIICKTPFFKFENRFLIDLQNKRLISCHSERSWIETPEGITHICKGAFVHLKNLSTIVLTNGITHIGESAFVGCDNLNNIRFPETLTHIGKSAFCGCEGLTSINLPNGLTNIDDKAFLGCYYLSSVTLSDSLTTIGESAFSLCKCLSSITLPNKLTQISNDVFVGCENLTRISLPNSLTYIGDSAFYGCRGLTEIKLPDNLTHIGEKAFYDCVRLAHIVFPESLTQIGELAFKNCLKLSSIDVPSGMREYYEAILPPDLHDKIKEEFRFVNNIVEEFNPYYLFFDTETTGVPQDYNAPASNTENWPRLVQLGWILTDGTGVIISSGNEIVKPEGFVIPSDASHVHGITTEIALRDGKPLRQVIQSFLKDSNGAKCFVGHNVSFDQRVVGAELYRLGIADTISTAKSLDTMKAATDYCKIPGTYGYKWPKLIELHRKLFGCDFEDAHDAMADITATKKCFFEMKRRGLI
jgi:DNA polymerase III epsilon subunit-like protein